MDLMFPIYISDLFGTTHPDFIEPFLNPPQSGRAAIAESAAGS